MKRTNTEGFKCEHCLSYAEPYVYIFVREDLSPIQRTVQTAHAALKGGKLMDLPTACNLVIVGVPDEKELRKLSRKLTEHDVRFETFWEPDNMLGFTALITETFYGKDRDHFKDFELLQ